MAKMKDIWHARCYGVHNTYETEVLVASSSPWKLTFNNQLEFERVARRYYDIKENFYFDDVDCVDGRVLWIQPTIRDVKCDGSLTWGEAIDRLKKYFKAHPKPKR